MDRIVEQLRDVAGIETGLLYSRRTMLHEAAETIERLTRESQASAVAYAGLMAAKEQWRRECHRAKERALAAEAQRDGDVARIKVQRDNALIEMERFMNIVTDCCDIVGLEHEDLDRLPAEVTAIRAARQKPDQALG